MNHDVAALLLQKYGKKNPAQLKAGDTVRVHQMITEGDKKRVQVFEGLVISTKHGMGLDGSFTVRKIGANSIGVERTYPVHSPNIVKIERIKSADVSRAKLYYMRERAGKSARFKSEVRSLATWDETSAAVQEGVASEEEIEVLHEQVVSGAEGTVEAEALASLEESAPADEAVDVEVAAVEAAAVQEEEVAAKAE